MYGYSSSEDQQPVVWLRGHPVYAAYFVVLVFAASMLVTAIFMALHILQPWSWLLFNSGDVLRGHVWRIFTYGLWNPPSLWFVVDMAIIALFGRELEKFFGRQKFLLLYGGIYLLPPLLFTLIGVWRPLQLVGETGAFALFVAFATLYPDVAVCWSLLAKWIAGVLFGVYSLIALADRDWVGALSLWATSGFAFAYVRYQQGRFTLPQFRLPRRAPKLRVIEGTGGNASPGVRARVTAMAEVDALLDKIACSGVSSLTAKERATLDSARDTLIKRESGRQ